MEAIGLREPLTPLESIFLDLHLLTYLNDETEDPGSPRTLASETLSDWASRDREYKIRKRKLHG